MQFVVDAIPVLLVAAVAVLCWAVIPGVVAGWMLREAGGSYARGFILGAVCGPFGVLGALAYILVTSLWDVRRRAARKRAGTRHMYRRVPMVGSLHVSTVWSLAGLATFACVWVLGVVGYELYLSRRRALREGERVAPPAADTRPPAVPDVEPGGGAEPDAEAARAEAAPPLALAGKSPRSTSSALLDGLAARPPERGQPPSGPAAEPRAGGQPQPFGTAGATPAATAAPALTEKATAAEQRAAATPAAPRQPAVSRESVVSELTQSLGARGYRVHATVSGDARTSTLSLSCATLSRSLGNQLVGNSRTRAALKAAGFRIVVMINGQESWTYIL